MMEHLVLPVNTHILEKTVLTSVTVTATVSVTQSEVASARLAGEVIHVTETGTSVRTIRPVLRTRSVSTLLAISLAHADMDTVWLMAFVRTSMSVLA